MAADAPLRILHVFGGLNRGGAETWIMHVLRHIDRERYRIDFLVQTDKPCAFDEEARALGARIISCTRPGRPWVFARQFARVMSAHGPYDILHSHVHHYSGVMCWLAARAGIPVRIAHSHSDTSVREAQAPLPRRAYLALTEALVRRYATWGIGAGRGAAAALFGPDWAQHPRRDILYCGVNLAPFAEPLDRAAVRAELGISANALLLGHVGRFIPAKNHAKLLEIAAEVRARRPETRLLLVGDGPLRAESEALCDRLGLRDATIFAGIRTDVPRLMRALDVFVLPSRFEGLPLVGMEVQAAGIPLVMSEAVTDETDVVLPLICRLSPDQTANAWADAVLAAAALEYPKADALAAMQVSPFSIENSVGALTALYDALHAGR